MHFRIPDFPLGALLATILCSVGLLFISTEFPTMWLWETLIALSFLVWALGAGLLSKPRKFARPERHNPKPGVETGPIGNIENSDIAVQMAFLIEVIKTEGRANRKEERREDYEAKLREQITIVFIEITMFAIILQVHEMVKAYEPIREQARAANNQATAALKQANAATIQAQGVKDQTEAAKEAALSSRENAVAAGRAWVGPSGATLNSAPILNQDATIVISYQNTGREPATGFITSSDVFTVDTTSPKSLSEGEAKVLENVNKCIARMPIDGAQVVYPSTGFGGNQMSVQISKTKLDQLVIDGKSYIVTTGCFAYKTFKAPHGSAFCFLYKKDLTVLPNLNFCPGGGYAD